jgi:hypothetical protein
VARRLLSQFGLRDLFSSSADVGTNKKPMFAEYSRHDSKDVNALCESSERSAFARFDVGRAIGVSLVNFSAFSSCDSAASLLSFPARVPRTSRHKTASDGLV